MDNSNGALSSKENGRLFKLESNFSIAVIKGQPYLFGFNAEPHDRHTVRDSRRTCKEPGIRKQVKCIQ